MLKLTSAGIDLGIVVTELDRSVAFYRDVLGLADDGEMPMPGGGLMRRFRCGDSVLKLIKPTQEPSQTDPGNGFVGSTGLRYLTISLGNLDEAHERCVEAGVAVVMAPIDLRPGVRIAMVEDPDGNWVEFLELADTPG